MVFQDIDPLRFGGVAKKVNLAKKRGKRLKRTPEEFAQTARALSSANAALRKFGSEGAGPSSAFRVDAQPEVRAAVMSGVKGTALRLLLKSPIGSRIGRLLGRESAVGGIASRPFSLAEKIVFGAGAAATVTAGAVADEFIVGAARGVPGVGQFIPGGASMPSGPGNAGRSLATLPGVGGQLPPGSTVVKVWDTGTARFARLADGRIAVQRKDGTIKTYRPQKHIVIPRNPRVGTLIRADKRLKRLTKGLKKAVK